MAESLSLGPRKSEVRAPDVEELGGGVPQLALGRFVAAGLRAPQGRGAMGGKVASGDAGEGAVGGESHDDLGAVSGVADVQSG
jgi:hypothetical protein